MDRKDEIILKQYEIIRGLTERSLKSERGLGGVGSDFWGAPQMEQVEKKQQAASPAPAKPEPAPEEEKPETIDELKAELAGYIGLEGVKKEVSNLINMMTVWKMRKEHGLPNVEMSLHMVFSGNPGTGKTMIARLMARIYRSLGILSKGQLVETDRSGLVAGFVGQTAQKTAEVIEKAKGGVLFIDEAYALNGSGQNDFGQEAIDTLLKAMEDNREDLVVIVAGYDQLMENFIRSNPGLESRFNRYLHFDDYSVDEMCQILEMQLKKHQYTLDEEGKKAARDYIEASNTHTISFGNARGVRNIFERLLVQQANRLAGQQGVTVEDLMTITAADVQKTRETDDKLNDALKKEQEIIDSTQKLIDELQTGLPESPEK